MEGEDCVVCYDLTSYRIPNCKHYVCDRCTDKMTVNKNLCPYCRTVRGDICTCCNNTLINCTLSCVRYLFMTTIQSTKPLFKVGDYVVIRWRIPTLGHQLINVHEGYLEWVLSKYIHPVRGIKWDSRMGTFIYTVKINNILVMCSEDGLMSYNELHGYNYSQMISYEDNDDYYYNDDFDGMEDCSDDDDYLYDE